MSLPPPSLSIYIHTHTPTLPADPCYPTEAATRDNSYVTPLWATLKQYAALSIPRSGVRLDNFWGASPKAFYSFLTSFSFEWTASGGTTAVNAAVCAVHSLELPALHCKFIEIHDQGIHLLQGDKVPSRSCHAICKGSSRRSRRCMYQLPFLGMENTPCYCMPNIHAHMVKIYFVPPEPCILTDHFCSGFETARYSWGYNRVSISVHQGGKKTTPTNTQQQKTSNSKPHIKWVSTYKWERGY